MDVFYSQIEEIKKHRWLESEKAGHDVGLDWAALDWVTKYAGKYREYWKSHAH